MPNDVSLWAALADSKRRQIISYLEEKPRTTSELSQYFDVSRYAVMKHLNVLEKADLIKIKREGRKRWNFLNDDLTHFLRTKLGAEDGPNRLVDILDLFPEHNQADSVIRTTTEMVEIQDEVILAATLAKVFTAFTTDIDSWWSQRSTISSRIHLEPRVNGRFYEAFNEAGHGVLYGTITSIKQDREVRLRGTPELTEQLMDEPCADNFVQIDLESKDKAAKLTLSHRIIGSLEESTQAACKHRWHRLINKHLRAFVEEGIPRRKQT